MTSGLPRHETLLFCDVLRIKGWALPNIISKPVMRTQVSQYTVNPNEQPPPMGVYVHFLPAKNSAGLYINIALSFILC